MEPRWGLSRFPRNLEQLEDEWSLLRPRVTKLINRVSGENMADTADQFAKLGFPWVDSKLMVPFAHLIVAASASHGFYAECYAELISVLSKQCETSSLVCATLQELESGLSTPRHTVFIAAVKSGLSDQFRDILSAMTKDASVSTAGYPNKLRDRLVNCCKLAASLFHQGVSSVDEVTLVLQRLGVLNTVDFREDVTDTSNQGARSARPGMPQVAMLSGTYPLSQPVRGETMTDWRTRLAHELNFPADRLGLWDGESEVPCDACLDDLKGMLQVVLRQVYIKEEYRVEAASTLLLKAMPCLLSSEKGQELVKQVCARWEPGVDAFDLLPKRAHFMIMDVKHASAQLTVGCVVAACVTRSLSGGFL